MVTKNGALEAMSIEPRKSEDKPKDKVQPQTKERWERSLGMKQLALELVCPVVNAKKEFMKEMVKACEEDGELDAVYYVDWAIKQADLELALDDPDDDVEEEEDAEEEDDGEDDSEE